ncbi:MAG: heavy-metal-associated domain-containing protein [Chitinophagaceae bacterium]|nr:heavy-metal-associated domain-containing protein [Chitinophagaceae bacterium]
MKTFFLIAFAIFFTASSNAQFQTANLTAAGLTCAMCTKAIHNSLQKLPVVEKVDADIKNSEFILTFKKDAVVDPDLLKKAVEDAGFSVSKLKLTGDFNDVKVNNDTHIQLGGKTYHFIKIKDKVLSGTQSITIVDKNYVSSKEFKKILASTDHPCVETGKAGECCERLGTARNARIYHVTL